MDFLLSAVPASAAFAQTNLVGMDLLAPIVGPALALTAGAILLLVRDAIRPAMFQPAQRRSA